MKSNHYSLEERMVEPFRAIRWIEVSSMTYVFTELGLASFAILWWFSKQFVFNFWGDCLEFFTKLTHAPWSISTGYWPEFAKPLIYLPKLSASIGPPSTLTWWSFAIASISVWIYTDSWKSKYLPLKAILRFVVFLIFTSLACFAIAPMGFQHSVEEWSKIYFLAAYGSFLIYALIWTLSVLWFPISTFVKVLSTLTLIAYALVGIPLLLFFSTLLLSYSSLLLLPLFALGIAPLLQMGWFICFYSVALSHGSDPTKEVRFE